MLRRSVTSKRARKQSRSRALTLERLENRELLSIATAFDFGTATSPVQAGYTQVTNKTAYTATLGYGWQSGTIYAKNTGKGTALACDYNYTSKGTFAANLPNGTYDVTVTAGNLATTSTRTVDVSLDGALVAALPANDTCASNSYDVTVQDGQLDVALQCLASSKPSTLNYAAIYALSIASVSQPVSLSPGSLPASTVGMAYSQKFTASGGTGSTTLGESGTLPAGLAFTASTGTLSGTPTASGTFNLSVTATDSAGDTTSDNYTLTINPAVSLSPSSLPASTLGVAYSQKFTATGGTGSITLSESGSLPAGLTFTASTGTLSGTSTASGTFNISVLATDSVGATASGNYTLTINPAVSLSPSSLPASTVGVAYSQKFTATGGTGSITLSESGALPAGLTFTASTGTLSGTPTASGTFNISVLATDSVGATTSDSYSLTVNPATDPALSISPSSLPASTVGVAYSQKFTASGGSSITLSESGTLPAGLTFTASTGTLSGTPSASGTFSLTVKATDSAGDTTSQNYSLIINPTPSISPSSLSAGTVGVAYSEQFTATGGTGAVTLSESGSLPAGLTFTASSGTLSGTPTASGTSSFSVTATDSVGATATDTYSLTVNPASTSGIACVQGASLGLNSSGTSQATGAFASKPTIGNYILVSCWAWNQNREWTSSDITCSDNLATHNTYTQVGFVQSGYDVFCFFYAKVTSTGAGYTPVVTLNTVGNSAISVAASEFSGIASSNPIDGSAVTATGTGSPASLGNMTVRASDLVLAGLNWDECSAVSISQPSGWTRQGLDDASVDSSCTTAYGDAIYSIASSSTTAPSWSVSGGTTSGTDGWCASQVAFLPVGAPLEVCPSSVPSGVEGHLYSQQFTASGGSGSGITLSETGTLPAGLTFTASSGTLSGTPTASGTFSFSVVATDSASDKATQNYSLVISSSTTTGSGTTYYVAATGNDNNAGTEASPFATLQRGVSFLVPGDTLDIEPGTYAGFIAGWDSTPIGPQGTGGDQYGVLAGTAAEPITIQADPSAAPGSVIINAKNNETHYGIDIEPGCDYVTVKGITISDTGNITNSGVRGGGIKLCGNYDAAISNTISNIVYGFGIIADNANDVLLQNNTISGTGNQGDGDYGHGIYLSGTNSGAVIEGNVIFNNAYIGIHVNGDASEGVAGLVTDALIEDNVIYNNGQNGINADGLQSSVIENNLIYGFQSYGICMYQIDAGGPSSNNVLVNNTIESAVSGAVWPSASWMGAQATPC